MASGSPPPSASKARLAALELELADLRRLVELEERAAAASPAAVAPAAAARASK